MKYSDLVNGTLRNIKALDGTILIAFMLNEFRSFLCENTCEAYFLKSANTGKNRKKCGKFRAIALNKFKGALSSAASNFQFEQLPKTGITLNKLELIDTLKDECQLAKKEDAVIVDIFFDQISTALAEGDRVDY